MTAMLTTYEDFVARVESLGFMALSPLLPGLPCLSDETTKSQWHTGLDTDPWRWKDRVAEEKHLAYGCILGGNKGFVARRMYPIFYAAFHPMLSMPKRWASGTVKQKTWRVWQLFEEKGTLNEYYITVDGNERKISAKGEFYGWPVNRYCRVADWVPVGWLDSANDWSVEEARELIPDDGMAMSKGVNRQDLAKKLGLR